MFISSHICRYDRNADGDKEKERRKLIMNKLFTKVAALSVGLAMAIGVGVALGGQKAPVRANAAVAWTSVGTLRAGDQIVIANASAKKELTGVASNIGTATDYSTADQPNGTFVLTVEDGSAANSYAFKNGNNYLAYTGSGNNLHTVTSKGQNSSWTINGSAGSIRLYNVQYNTRRLVYNSGSPRFCCYTSNQQALTLYKMGGATPLSAPVPSYDSTNKEVTWSAVANAVSYKVSVDSTADDDYATATSPYDVSGLTTGVQHTVYVKAIGDGTNYSDSTAGSVSFTIPSATTAGSATITLGTDTANGQWHAGNSATHTESTCKLTWTVAYTTESVSGQSGYIQFGANAKPLSALSFESSAFTQAMNLTAFSIYYGGSGNGATSTATLKIDSTTLKAGNGVTDSGTETLSWSGTQSVASGSKLAIDFSGLAKGTKVHTISYTLADPSAPTTYTVTYDGNDATGGTAPVDSTEYSSGQTVTVAGNTGSLVKTGHTFNGWNTDRNPAQGTHYNVGATFNISGSVTLYAEWTVNQYTLTYNANGGTGTAPEGGTYNYGAQVTVADDNGLVKSGFVFGGWNTASDGTGTTYAPESKITIAGDTILYAKWGEPLAELTRVEDVAFLSEGDEIAIVSAGSGSQKALSTTQNDNNRGSVTVTVSAQYKFEADADVQIITLGKSNGNWTFNVGDGYLYAASSSANHLKTEASLDDNHNGEWAISISSGVASITAQGSNTRNQLKNNGSLFSCYASGQTDVSIYRVGELRELDSITSISATISASTGDTEWTMTNVSVSGRFTDSVADEDVTQYVTEPVIQTAVPEITQSGTYPVSVYAEGKFDSSITKTETITATLTAVTTSALTPGTNGYSDSSETTPMSWANGVKAEFVYLNTIEFHAQGGANTGKYYTNGTNWRFYQNESAKLKISAQLGYLISEITFTFNYESNGKLINPNDGTSMISSASAWTPTTPGRSFTFEIGSTSGSSGQIKFTQIAVKYSATSDPVVSIDELQNEICKDDTGTFSVHSLNATNPSYSWETSDANILTVNSSTGAYEAVGAGVVTVTVTMTCTEGGAIDRVTFTVGAGSISIEEANTIAAALESGAQTTYKVIISGYLISLDADNKGAGSERALRIANYKVGETADDDIMIYGIYSNDAMRNYIILNGTITFEGYLKNYSGNYQLVSPELVDYTDDAIEYAHDSYASLNEVCSLYGPEGVTDSQWNTLSGNFSALDEYAQAKLVDENSPTYSEDIANWIGRYTIIVQQGGKSDFMDLGLTPGSSGRIAILGKIGEVSIDTTLIVIVASVLCVAGIGGYFFLRRKKEQ